MFASHEKNFGKKSFQKPNILRRKGKVTKPNISYHESPEAISLVTTTHMEKTNVSDQLDTITKLEVSNDCNESTNVTKTAWKLTLADDCEDGHILQSLETDIDATTISNAPVTEIKSKSLEEHSLNIESFINNAGSIEQDLPIPCDTTVSAEIKSTREKTKWCFDLNNSMDIIINNYREQQLGDLEEKLDSVIVVPSAPSDQHLQQVHDQVLSATTTQTLAVDCYSNRAVKFKCDQPNCNKGFWSEEKLRKHKNSHNRQAYRTPTQITYECPVKKVADDGSEEKCPRTYVVRGDLLKHLDEDHTLDEAQHRCLVCGRRFFWAMGLRAHAASLCARGGLACAWPGCGRVFRLPCRLREHARAHTGDRPYLCRYPDCGWAFRSASKLVRHARRHTDERKHACATCGRAFMRREHLRDHCARHHQRAARATHLCTHPGCMQSFTNMSTLYMHMKKVHRKVEQADDPSANVTQVAESVYLVSLPEPVLVEEDASSNVISMGAELQKVQSESVGSSVARSGDVGVAGVAGCGDVVDIGDVGDVGELGDAGDAEWHAARTHCTWPLPRPALTHYVLDDDVHVARTEGSDVYTVRSDLFLHGNVPIDEDSQQIVGAALSGSAALDADLCPTIDLMQEELMYEDAADESSFRVLLMNGEELT